MADDYSAAERRNQQRQQQSWSAPEIARRNIESLGKPIGPVLKTAATACELAHKPAARRKSGE